MSRLLDRLNRLRLRFSSCTETSTVSSLFHRSSEFSTGSSPRQLLCGSIGTAAQAAGIAFHRTEKRSTGRRPVMRTINRVGSGHGSGLLATSQNWDDRGENTKLPFANERLDVFGTSRCVFGVPGYCKNALENTKI